MEILLLAVYGFFVSFLFLYSLAQLHLLLLFWKSKKNAFLLPPLAIDDIENVPSVTVQLPIYNEKYVIARLIKAVVALDYPKQRLEVQVLDDSTDETFEIVAKLVAQYKAEGFLIAHICRSERTGFKAGALKYGLSIAKGDFTAIFDADFVPPADFLRKTMPHFQNPKIGLVQTRWTHLNKEYSLLTRLQAFALDAHFNIEQGGRNYGKHFINFNGTAGVWRNECIIEAGNWQADTLTEDLDLSYRAQLKGWQFQYLNQVGTPAELPVEMNAMKSQQFRWTKGAAECTRKNLGKVLLAPNLPIFTKLHGLFHLMNSFVFISILMISLLSVPILWVKHSFASYAFLFQLASVFLLSFGILGFFYWSSENQIRQRTWRDVPQFLLDFVLFLSLSMGMSLHNALAVFEGYIGKKSPFVRTPKFNVQAKQDRWQGNTYFKSMLSGLTLVEAILAVYYLGGVFLAFYFGDFGLLPFHSMLAFGFGYVAWHTLRHSFVRIKV